MPDHTRAAVVAAGLALCLLAGLAGLLLRWAGDWRREERERAEELRQRSRCNERCRP